MPSPLLKYFKYDHLPAKLQEVSKPIHDLAHKLDGEVRDSTQKESGMFMLLQAKDCFVRATLP